jgi:hypothetical protein
MIEGGAKCWGMNAFGRVMLLVFFDDVLISVFVKSPFVSVQLGDGSSGNQHLTPYDVFGLSSGVVSLALGDVRTFLSHSLLDS